MKKTVNIKAVSPGQAELHIAPWAEEIDGLELGIVRNEGEPHLNPQLQQWVGEEHWIRLQGARVVDASLVMHLDASVVDPLLEGSQNARCQARLRIAGNAPQSYTLRIDRDVLPSTAAGDAPVIGGSSQIHAPVIASLPESPAENLTPAVGNDTDTPPETSTATNVQPSAGKKKPVALLAILLLALLLAIGAVVYFLFLRPDSPPVSDSASSTATPVAASTSACSTENLTNTDALGFVQSCIREVQDSTALLTIIQAARAAGQCEIAQRLYANRANAGDTRIALAYAQEYDPATHQDNACFQAEAATARYWYESVLEREPEHAEARQRLQALPQ